MIEAVIFDMDGVLVDSEPFWQASEKRAFSRVGIHLSDDMCRMTTGLRVDEVVRFWFKRYPWKGLSMKDVESEIIDGVLRDVSVKAAPMPGVVEVLTLLKGLGLRIGLASSSSGLLIRAVLEKLAIKDFFEVTVSAEGEAHGKPHPAVYMTAAKKLGLRPQECLAVEDSVNGMRSAAGAGMKVIVVPDPSSSGDESFLEADLVLESLLHMEKRHLDLLGGCFRDC